LAPAPKPPDRWMKDGIDGWRDPHAALLSRSPPARGAA